MPRKKADALADQLPLTLTEPERQAVIDAPQLKPAIRKKFEAAGEGTALFTAKELETLSDHLGEAALFMDAPRKKHLQAVLRKVAKLVEATEAAALVLSPRPASGAEPEAFQFEITLLDIKPPVWRRIRVPDCTLGVFHWYIQAAFGWEGYHMHQFAIEGEAYGTPDPDGMDFGMDTADENLVTLSGLLPASRRKARWIYEYDFGDGWRHEILFEGFPAPEPGEKEPRCIDGKRACPPEDCGGPWGYADFLAALANPRHERHDELSVWAGPFDPEAFDPAEATAEMRKVGRPKRRRR
jgi:hypothetical protein